MMPTKVQAGRFLGLRTALVAMTLMLPAAARAQGPQVGQVQRLRVITLSLRVGSTEKEVRQVTYSPPPGWYVRSHTVACTSRYGNSSFSVNTVPQNWDWLSEEKVRESYKLLLDLAGKAHDLGLGAKFVRERDVTLQELRRVRAAHHALIVEATARGEGFLRGGGAIELTVTAELVYVGTEEGLERTAAQQRARLK